MLVHKARKRFGQNFLHDQHIIQRIVQAITPQYEDLMIEIGPGQGALTRPLSDKLSHLHAIEIDRDLYAWLKTQFPADQLTLHNIDALKFDLRALVSQSTAKQKCRIVGNLPYNISTPLLFHLMNSVDLIEDMYFMLQKEVVDRMAAEPGSKTYGRLSVMLQYYCQIQPLFTVKPGAFQPAPAVDSAIVKLRPYSKAPVEIDNIEAFQKVVALAFAQRRKTLRNNLKSQLTAAQIMHCNIDPGKRPEQLSLQEFARLANVV